MPYILVNMVSDLLSLILFCMTGAALLSKYPLTNRYLPAPLRNHSTLAFVAQGLVLSVLSIGVIVLARARNEYMLMRFVFELFGYVGLANAVVLTYQFLDRRYFLRTPKVQRRLLIAICAMAMTSAAAIAVATAVVGLFIIR